MLLVVWPVQPGGEQIILSAVPTDALYEVRAIEEASISTVEELHSLQTQLVSIQPHKMPKRYRKQVAEARMIAQEKLDIKICQEVKLWAVKTAI